MVAAVLNLHEAACVTGNAIETPCCVVNSGRLSPTEVNATVMFSMSHAIDTTNVSVKSDAWLRTMVLKTCWYPTSPNHSQSV